jgi:Na+-transporting methylmalonyl-CoA/oxaloacetate decarboxylase gamma subunit
MITLRNVFIGLAFLAVAMLGIGAFAFDFFPTRVNATLATMLVLDVAGVLAIQYAMREETK